MASADAPHTSPAEGRMRALDDGGSAVAATAADVDHHNDFYALLNRMLSRYELLSAQWRKQSGLSANERLVLVQLVSDGPLTATELSQRVGISTGGLTTVLDRLERGRYLVRKRDENDRRRILLFASQGVLDEGFRIAADLAQDLESVWKGFDESERGAIQQALRTATQVFSRHAGWPELDASAS